SMRKSLQAKYGRIALALTCALLACFIGVIPTAAQQVTATITGQVTDPSGAAVPGAKVTATDTQRGTQYTAQTNSDGRYTISNILVGTYGVKVENAGFQTATQSNITLQLNQVAKLDFSLQVGNVA